MTRNAGRSDGARNAALDRLRAGRVRPDRATGIGDDLAAFLKGLKKVSAQAARAGEAWETAAPDGVRATTRVVDLRAGTLVVEVRSAADRHVADHWVRAAGLAEVRALGRTPITRVRFVLVPDGWEPPTDP